MDFKEVMGQLEKMGTEQNVKVYRRHGAGEKVFGVSFANLDKLKKKIKRDHELAVKLWESGNTDARTLAAMIADPAEIKRIELDKWLKETSYYHLVDYIAGLAAKTPMNKDMAFKWMKSKEEFVRQAGYVTLSINLKDNVPYDQNELESIMETIAAEIHDSPNRARHAMNNALIAIGIYRPDLTQKAIAYAGKIGKVEVDHGETSCKTPDAVSYIEKAIKRQRPRKK